MTQPYYYYKINGLQRGPVSLEELKALIESGKLAAEDMISENASAWIPVRLFGKSREEFCSGIANHKSNRQSDFLFQKV